MTIGERKLSLPEKTKQFLISPPPSPPVGWEPTEEQAPVVDYKLLAALSELRPAGKICDIHVQHVLLLWALNERTNYSVFMNWATETTTLKQLTVHMGSYGVTIDLLAVSCYHYVAVILNDISDGSRK